MKTVNYECDRCGESIAATLVQDLKVEFNKLNRASVATRLPDLQTGDLCPECAHNFSETFFNAISAWRSNRKHPALDEIRKI